MVKKLSLIQIKKKYASWEKLYKYEEEYYVKRLIEKADTVFATFIRKRDAFKGCVSYWAEWCQNNTSQCCHWIWRAFYSHRWDKENCYWGCINCNKYRQEEHKIFFTRWIVANKWLKRTDIQLKTRHKDKPWIEYLLKVIEKYS